MKIRIFKKDDGTVVYTNFNWNKQKADESDVDFMNRITINNDSFKFKDLPFIDVDSDQIPISNSQTEEYHERIYFDGECALENLKTDDNWEKVLMPVFLIQKKYFKKINNSLDAALENKDISSEEIMNLIIKKEKAKKFDNIQWYEQSIKNIDSRVTNGESDKPVIREKLKAKIKELKGE